MQILRRFLLPCIVAVLLLPPVSFASPSDEQAMLERAKQHFANGEYYFATPWLERLLKKYPATSRRKEVLLLLVKSYAATSWGGERAREALKTLVKDYPDVAGSLEPELLKLAGEAQPEPLPVEEILTPEPPKNQPAAAAPAISATPAAVPPPAVPAAAPPAAPVEAAVPPAAAPPAAPIQPAVTPPAAPSIPAPSAASEGKPKAKVVAKGAEASGTQATPAVAPVTVGQKTPKQRQEMAKEVKPPQPISAVGQQAAAVAKKGFAIKVGEYLFLSGMEEARKKIVKAGLVPEVIPGPKKMESMIRLYLGEFREREAARKLLDRLRQAQGEGFILTGKSRTYHLYAGSYKNQIFAAQEQQRLASRGIKASLQKKPVPVPTFILSAGTYTSRDAALLDAAKLEAEGMQPVVISLD